MEHPTKPPAWTWLDTVCFAVFSTLVLALIVSIPWLAPMLADRFANG